MPFAENNGVRIHWQEQGSGTPILLIMGHRYSSAMWYPILPALAARHRVITFDNRGSGESGATRETSVAEMVADTVAVMDAAGVARAHVFGVSMGGVLALELAISHPARVQSLMIGGSGMLTPDKPRMPPILLNLYHLPPGLLNLIVTGPRKNRGYGSAATKAQIAADQEALLRDKHNVAGVIAQAKAIANYNTTKEIVGALTMPALILHGEEDPVVKLDWGKELAAILPGSRFVGFKGAGHNFPVVAPEETVKVLLDFIDGVERKA